MNRFFVRALAFPLLALPLAFVARAETSTPSPSPTPKPTKTPRPRKTRRPKATPAPTASATPTPSATPRQTRDAVPVSASDADNGKTIYVARGGVIELRLASNPSTGYSWNIISNRGLTRDGDGTYEPTPHPPQVVGSGGFSVFRFRPTRADKAEIALDLRAPGFKTGDKPAQTFRADVRVLK